jgi:regulator of protease activity HflC (stomatin/prohibitin superfamily)
VREIFSTKRQELQDVIEAELKPLFASDGLVLRAVTMGNVDLPRDYRAGMDKLLAIELESEQMKYTLDLKEKQVKQSALEADADKVRREKAAEASANEQIIAAKAQEEAMKHVIPFKQKQIEQKKLEAEADKTSRIKLAEGSAEARRIEAGGEADSRRKLADAEAYRVEELGKVTSAQMARDGELISRHPLLIQKTLAVIIAPPPADGSFIGSTLLGNAATSAVAQNVSTETAGAP